jgi:hypothetical protein
MKRVPQQFPLVLDTIKETPIEEGNFYIAETRWMQFKSLVSQTFATEEQHLEYKSMTWEEKNQFLQDLLQGIKGEAIDQIIVIVDRVTREGTRYQINEPLQTKKYD